MYKDKHLQREANKKASQRRRDKIKGMTQGMTNEGMTAVNEQTHVIPCSNSGTSVIPKGTAMGITTEPITTKPGDVFEKTVWESEPGAANKIGEIMKPKRGKDIKCFEDLPPDIQQTINTLSDDEAEHKRRTAIAINYQHQFPDRYHSTGVV